jgi:single-strand DNA-binding protein
MNSWNVIGRAGKDAVLRHTPNGKQVLAFSLAVDSGFGDSKQTVWVDCSLWGQRGERLAEYIHKGDQVGVTGEVGTREYNGKTYVTLNVQDVTLTGGKRDAPKSEPAKPVATPREEFEDSIPF